MILKIAICDDENKEIIYQADLIERCLQKHNRKVQIIKCHSGEELLLSIEEKGTPDAIFLDIEMNGKNGIETAEQIREKNFSVPLIFVSNYDSYCKTLIHVQPFAFLDKPAEESTINAVVEKLLKHKNESADSYYYFDWKRVRYQLPISKIRYFSSQHHLITINTTDETYQFYGTLDNVAKELKNCRTSFLRIHKSWLVNTLYIKEYHYEQLILSDGEPLIISKANRSCIRERYMKMLEAQTNEWN